MLFLVAGERSPEQTPFQARTGPLRLHVDSLLALRPTDDTIPRLRCFLSTYRRMIRGSGSLYAPLTRRPGILTMIQSERLVAPSLLPADGYLSFHAW